MQGRDRKKGGLLIKYPVLLAAPFPKSEGKGTANSTQDLLFRKHEAFAKQKPWAMRHEASTQRKFCVG